MIQLGDPSAYDVGKQPELMEYHSFGFDKITLDL